MENLDLPDSLSSWRHLDITQDPRWSRPWDYLRPSFEEAGYTLYKSRLNNSFTIPVTNTSPALESFGLHGDRINFNSDFPPIAAVFAARDRQNRDVVIKVISKGKEGETEEQILRYLSSEPLRSDPANRTVKVIEFLEFQGFTFAVMPCCDGSADRPFSTASECLDFAEQVLESLSFLHEHRVAHLDISPENILMNHRGKLPETHFIRSPSDRVVRDEWRSTFPVQYYLIDFGFSVLYTVKRSLSEYTVDSCRSVREQRAPEVDSRKPFNPFPADVYQTARLLYSLLQTIAHDVPGLLKLFQDMSSCNPSRRITASNALERFRNLRSTIPDDNRERDIWDFPLIPARNGHWAQLKACLTKLTGYSRVAGKKKL